jgi:hypothetical protein
MPPYLRNRVLGIAPAVIVCISLGGLLSGCVSTPGAPTISVGGALGLEFPDQRILVDWGNFHDVNVRLELEDAIDPYPIIPRRRGGLEIYKFDADHSMEFRNTVLHVEDTPYPFGSRASLILFLPRLGTWEFRYRGVPIAIEHEGWWKPVVLLDQVYGDSIEADLRETRQSARRRAYTRGREKETWKEVERPLVEEALKVGRQLIIFRPDAPYLEVNEKRVPIRDGLSISIDARGRVSYQH